jgi:predicted amidohydrolase
MKPPTTDQSSAQQPVPRLRVAALQMVSTPRVDENLRTAADLIAEAVAQGAELLALPEYFAIMGMTDATRWRARVRWQRPDPGFPRGQRAPARHLADRRLAAAVEPTVPDKVLNSSLVYNPQGQRVARYDKIHLFGFRQGAECYDESATIEAGRQPVAFATPFGRVGLSICYDLRFPELYRALGVTDLLV